MKATTTQAVMVSLPVTERRAMVRAASEPTGRTAKAGGVSVVGVAADADAIAMVRVDPVVRAARAGQLRKIAGTPSAKVSRARDRSVARPVAAGSAAMMDVAGRGAVVTPVAGRAIATGDRRKAGHRRVRPRRLLPHRLLVRR